MTFSFNSSAPARRAGLLARTLLVASVIAMPLVLTGCSIFGGDDEEETPHYVARPCPSIGVLKGADRISVFNGNGHDMADLVVRAEIRKAVTKCEYDEDEYQISVDVGFDGTAFKGPAANSSTQNLQGFISVVKRGRIISKNVYDIPIEFDEGASEMRFLKTIEKTLVPFTERMNGSAYEIIVGFQVTPDQLKYNRTTPAIPMK